MCFDNLRTEVRAEQLGSLSRQPKEHVDSHAEIGCQNDRYRTSCIIDNMSLLLGVASRPYDEGFTMLQRGAADFTGGVGVTEVDNHITILHRPVDGIAQIALRGDSKVRIVLRQFANSFPHASGRAHEQYTHGRILHSRERLAIASIQILAGSCEVERGSLRSSRIAANELPPTSRRANRVLSSPEQG